MHFSVDEAVDYADKLIAQMKQQGLLIQSGKYLTAPQPTEQTFYSTWLLSRVAQETWQRYAVVLRVLESEKSIGRSQLEKQSTVIAERLSSLYGMSSPEFYDKNVLGSFVNALRENKLLVTLEDGTLEFSQDSLALKEVITPLVWPEIIQHLENIQQPE